MIQCKGVHDTIKWIKRTWKQFPKEIIADAWKAMIYNTWQARNWKLFQQTVNIKFITVQI